MKRVRLQVSGGFGGPATWTDLMINESEISSQDFERLFVDLTNLVNISEFGNQPTSSFADGQTYRIEFGNIADSCVIQVTDANITSQFEQLVSRIKKLAESRNAQKESRDGETKK